MSGSDVVGQSQTGSALDQVKMVVLDEADEMLDMGFRDDIEKVLKNVPTERQFICFSATMAKAIMDLINKFGRDPAVIHELRKDDTRNLESQGTRPTEEPHQGQLRSNKQRNSHSRDRGSR